MTNTESANKMQFEILSDESSRIHGRILKVYHHQEPFEDGTTHSLEATSDSRSKLGQFLEAHELRGVLASKLPVGFSIMIDKPKSQLKNITLVYFKNTQTGLEVSLGIYFDYVDWHLPINVIDFADLLKVELTEGPSKLTKVLIDKSDASVYLTCYATMDENDDLYGKFKELDDTITRAYRKCLQSIVVPRSSDNHHHMDDSSGVRWWIRYVIVPLVGSGTFAAIIAWLIAKHFFT